MEKTCENCGYCERASRGHPATWYCSNADSKYCADYVLLEQKCEAWTRKGKEYGK